MLVVAEKEQALRSLTSKIPEGIKDLTVAVLGADADSRREMESAIGQIQTQVTATDRTLPTSGFASSPPTLMPSTGRSRRLPAPCLPPARRMCKRLDGAWAAGQAPTSAEAAQWVADHAEAYGYIDDPVTPATPPPVTGGELAEFASLIHRVGVRRADACAALLPELTSLPMAEDLAGRLTAMQSLLTSVRSLDGAVRDWDRAIAQVP